MSQMVGNLLFVFLFCTALVAAYDPHEDIQMASRALNQINSEFETFVGRVSKLSAKRDGLPSLQCIAAYTAYAALPNCSISAEDSAICTPTCTALFTNLVTQCANDTNSNQTLVLSFLLSFRCLKDSNTGANCYQKFQLMSQTQLSASILNQFCGGDCLTQLYEKILALPGFFSNDQVQSFQRLIDLACTRVDGQYCLLIFQEWSTLEECNEGNFTCLNSRLRTVCTSKCLFKILAKLQAWKVAVDFDPAGFNFLCMKKPNTDEYCVPVVLGAVTAVGNKCPDLKANACSASTPNCPAALQTAKSTMGCCLRTWLNYDAIDNPSTSAKLLANLATCGISITADDKVCVLPGLLKFAKSFKINTPWTIAKPLIASIKESVTKDLIVILGITPSLVEVRESPDDGLTEIYFEFQGTTDEETQAASTQFQSQTSTTIYLPATSAAVVQSNPGTPVSVVPGSTKDVALSSSSGVQVLSFALLVLALIFVL